MSRWAEAWRDVSAGDGRGGAGGRAGSTPPRIENVAVDISNRLVCLEVRYGPSGIEVLVARGTTDPVRASAITIVNGWLAEGETLETQAIHLIALTDLVAGLIRLE